MNRFLSINTCHACTYASRGELKESKYSYTLCMYMVYHCVTKEGRIRPNGGEIPDWCPLPKAFGDENEYAAALIQQIEQRTPEERLKLLQDAHILDKDGNYCEGFFTPETIEKGK